MVPAIANDQVPTNLMIITEIVAKVNSTLCFINNPIIPVSVTIIPAGRNDKFPNSMEV